MTLRHCEQQDYDTPKHTQKKMNRMTVPTWLPWKAATEVSSVFTNNSCFPVFSKVMRRAWNHCQTAFASRAGRKKLIWGSQKKMIFCGPNTGANIWYLVWGRLNRIVIQVSKNNAEKWPSFRGQKTDSMSAFLVSFV